MNFEAFGSSPDFTTPIQQFLYNNCSKIEEAKQNGEQSINNYMLFKQYSELMDKTLEKTGIKLKKRLNFASIRMEEQIWNILEE